MTWQCPLCSGRTATHGTAHGALDSLHPTHRHTHTRTHGTAHWTRGAPHTAHTSRHTTASHTRRIRRGSRKAAFRQTRRELSVLLAEEGNVCSISRRISMHHCSLQQTNRMCAFELERKMIAFTPLTHTRALPPNERNVCPIN